MQGILGYNASNTAIFVQNRRMLYEMHIRPEKAVIYAIIAVIIL